MKIATNVHRDVFGGISISNLALFDWLEPREEIILGIEYTGSRHMRAATVFRRFEPAFFQHHVINCFDLLKKHPWQKVHGERFLRWRWAELIKETKKLLLEERPDIVLINGTYFAPWILSTVAKDLGIPVVLRYAGVLYRETENYKFHERQRLLQYERFIANTADTIVFPSSLCQKVVEEEVLGKKVKNGFIVPNPVHRPAVKHVQHTKRAIAAIGRWTAIKNFQKFAEIHEALQAEEWKHRAYIVTSSTNIGKIIPESILQIPPMSQEKLNQFYAELGLVIIPSHFETFCNVAAEAIFAGTPVLISRRVGIAEFFQAAGLERMIIPSFSNTELATQKVKELCGTKISKKEKLALWKLLNPHLVHKHLISILEDTVYDQKKKRKDVI